MQTIQTFDFAETPVRILEQNDQPWFVVSDVCRVLDIANPRDAVSELDEDEKGVGIADTPGGKQTVNTVSESGLYALIFKSRKENAKAFRKWVTSEVLPAIRRNGHYPAAPRAGLPDVLAVVQETILAVHTGRCPLNKATAISILTSQFLRGQSLLLPMLPRPDEK